MEESDLPAHPNREKGLRLVEKFHNTSPGLSFVSEEVTAWLQKLAAPTVAPLLPIDKVGDLCLFFFAAQFKSYIVFTSFGALLGVRRFQHRHDEAFQR